MSLPRAVAVMGPTAAGKSELGLEIAERLGRPILVCDSVKVYRRLDIGSAKPSGGQRRRAPHHLIDLVEPDAAFSAGDWARVAREAHQRTGGVFVGGTGFYLRALAWSQSGDATRAGVPTDDPDRAAFEARWRAREDADPGAAHRALVAADPPTAAEVHPHNLTRVIRALWLCHMHGEPVSAIRREDPQRPRMRLLLVVLDPGADALTDRISRRVDRMLGAGWLDEVEMLKQGGYDGRHKAMRSLGYRQLLEVVEGRMDRGSAKEAIVAATRQFAKRQRSYLRTQFPAAEVLELPDAAACPHDRIAAFLEERA